VTGISPPVGRALFDGKARIREPDMYRFMTAAERRCSKLANQSTTSATYPPALKKRTGGRAQMLNSHSNSVRTAMIMLKRHGLQASAVAEEREVMARLVPDVEGVDFWDSVQRLSPSFVAPRVGPTLAGTGSAWLSHNPAGRGRIPRRAGDGARAAKRIGPSARLSWRSNGRHRYRRSDSARRWRDGRAQPL
jgi:hypothetical protein